MIQIRTRVIGLERMRRMFIALTASEELAAKTAVARTALRIQDDAKRAAPVDTGRLRNSIATEVDGLNARVGTNTEYAPYVEFGTRFQPAQPYLFPAAEAARDPFHREIAALVRDGARSVR